MKNIWDHGWLGFLHSRCGCFPKFMWILHPPKNQSCGVSHPPNAKNCKIKRLIPKIVQILSRAFPRTIVSPKCTDRAFRYIIWVKGDSSEINFPELLAQIPAENHLHLAQSKKNKNSEQKRCTKWMGENPSSNGAKSANPDWLPIWISF